jgi:hypothetical protein
VSTGAGRRGFGRGNQHDDARRGWGPFIGLGWEVRRAEAVNGRRQSGTSMPSKFQFWDVMEGGGCASYWRGRGGLEWHLSWRGSGGGMAQRQGSARMWPVAMVPSVVRGRGRAALGLLGQKSQAGPRVQIGLGVVADLAFYAFVNKMSKIERL